MSSEVWPSGWSGSRVVEVHKNKGSKHICDVYQGIHLDNRLSKGLKEILNDDIKPMYEARMPSCQIGAVSRRGTDFASHVVPTFIDYCKLLQLCTFILYMDWSKAFDKALRELVVGIPAECDSPTVLREIRPAGAPGVLAPGVRLRPRPSDAAVGRPRQGRAIRQKPPRQELA
ncbi:unnamed protein product [Prorocentrum cordatum]|uniref:Reverse transcriptase domain-containing protein n=1 Tax=Prorocentrum cordatum TaxID=2364126 RepID=A0ABN9V593_9DINO|nr:unnamed protein product [Polarella glacialis]